MTTTAMPSAEINLRAIEEFSWTAKSEPDFRKRFSIALDYLGRILECDRGLVFGVRANGSIEILAHYGWESEQKRFLNLYMQQLIAQNAKNAKRLRVFRPGDIGVDASVGKQAIVLHHQLDDIQYFSSVLTTRSLDFTHADSLLVSALMGIALEVPETRPIKRKKDYHQAIQAKYEWEATVDALPELICLLDIDFKIIRANKTLEHWKLGRVDQVAGRSIHGLLHPGCSDSHCQITRVIENIRHYLPDRNEVEFEVADAPSNRVLRIHVSKHATGQKAIDSAIFDNTFAIMIVEDISERRAAEDTLRKYNERLEREVMERTLQLQKTNADLEKRIIQLENTELALKQSQQQLKTLSSQLLDAQENEGKRIALELHDSIGQSLTAIKFALEKEVHMCRESLPAENIRLFREIVQKLQHTVEDTRRISMALRPSILDDLGILSTINWFCREFQNTYNYLHITQDIAIDPSLINSRLSIVLYRIMQEAFNNIAKHARASEITIGLYKADNDDIVFMINDNGVGFDVDTYMRNPASMRGLGLVSQMERAELSGGQLKVDSKIGRGTTISASWPASSYRVN